jgi:hypothetical protein
MNDCSDFTKFVNLFSEKIKFNVKSYYCTNCFIILWVQPKKKLEESSLTYILTSITDKMIKFSGVKFLLITEITQYFSVLGNSFLLDCEKISPDLVIKKIKRRR